VNTFSILEDVLKKISAMKIRIHGDYHLGQVLFTGNDFVIIDFEGEPARSISERRLKRSALRDIAGMVRSFHYAAYTALMTNKTLSPENIQSLKIWADLWYQVTTGVFINTYLNIVNEAPFMPKEKDELKMMLDAYILEKAIYEVAYELNNRPEWVSMPIHAITQLIAD